MAENSTKKKREKPPPGGDDEAAHVSQRDESPPKKAPRRPNSARFRPKASADATEKSYADMVRELETSTAGRDASSGSKWLVR